MAQALEKFEERVKRKFYSPSWAIRYLKAGLPSDLNLDGSLKVEVFKELFLVERPKDFTLDQRIKAIFNDPQHNMLCIESGRGSGKSTFVQTIHMYDPDHEYEYPCIDFSKRRTDPNSTIYTYCEHELFRLFRKNYRKMCNNWEWFSNYKKDLHLLIDKFPDYSQCAPCYIDTLREAEACDDLERVDKLFAGHRERIEQFKDYDLKILLLLYLLSCINEPSVDNKRWLFIFDSIEVYFESNATNWIQTIDYVSDFVRAAFDSIDREDDFFTRITALFPIRTATSIQFASYSNPTLHQDRNLWGDGNEYIFSLERFDFASLALLKKLKYLKDIGGYGTPLFQRCFTIGSLLIPRQYIEAQLEQFDASPNQEFRLFTKTRLMPLFNYDFRKVIDRLYGILPSEAIPSNTFLALNSIQDNAKKVGITQEYVANGENMITARLIFNSLHNYSPNLFAEIGYQDFEKDHEPSIARTVFSFLYYSELKYYFNSATQDNWGGDYPGVPFRTLLNKLRPFSKRKLSDISSVLYNASIVMGNDQEHAHVNNIWGNLVVIKDLHRSLSFSQFQKIIHDYYFPDKMIEDNDVESNLLQCPVQLSDAGRCFTVWASKQYEFLLARSSSLCYSEPLFVYSVDDYRTIKSRLEKSFEIVHNIIKHVSIDKLVAGCLDVCSYCHKSSSKPETIKCVFFSNRNRESLFDCSLFQRYQECLMLIVDSIDYLDRFRIYIWQVACIGKSEKKAAELNNWLLDEISKFNSLFRILKEKVYNEFIDKRDVDLFFSEMLRLSEECKNKLRVKEIDKSSKAEKVLQYHDRLRLPRTTIWFNESEDLFKKAVEELKKNPNCRVYDTINDLKTNNSISTDLIEEQKKEDPQKDSIKNVLKNKMEPGINQDLLLWAVESPLYLKAVGSFDSNYEELIYALGSNERKRYTGSLALMKAIWRNHPELGLPPDYDHLATLEFDRGFYPKYRDHTTHMFKVFLLGLYLYEKQEKIQEVVAAKMNQDSFLAVWTLTSLYHDVGYMIDNDQTTEEMYKRMNDSLSQPLTNLFPDDFGTGTEKGILERRAFSPRRIERMFPLKKTIERRFEGKGKSVQLTVNESNPIKIYFEQTLKKGEAISREDQGRSYFDHGIVSAGIMLFFQEALCDYYFKFPEAELYEHQKAKLRFLRDTAQQYERYVEQAAFAVALHNIKKNWSGNRITDIAIEGVTIGDFQISLDAEPVAFLLRLCDELQCWDRQYYTYNSPAPIEGSKLCFERKNATLVLKISDKSTKDSITDALGNILTPSAEELLPMI